MVRSSDIAKKKSDVQEPQKADASSAFLRLSEIMQIKTTDVPSAKPAPGIPAVPEAGITQEEAGKSGALQTGGLQQETTENRGLETKADVPEPPAVAFDDRGSDSAGELYAEAKGLMRSAKAAVLRNQSPGIAPLLELVKRLVSQPVLIRDTHPLTMNHENERDYYIFQPIHTMFYALKIGRHMSYEKQQLMELGLCCMLQNIGMFLIPDPIIDKKGALAEEEISVIRRHPETGRDLLRPFHADYPWLLKCVYQHHERENGQGYPLGIKGDEITEYAKIIGLCDSYEAMTNNRPHRKAILQFDSVRQLIKSKEQQFSPQILKLFLEELTIYPIGSYVRLNNAAIGRVIATNKSQPMRPVISLLIDGKGNRVALEEKIDLAGNNLLTILDVVPEEDLPR